MQNEKSQLIIRRFFQAIHILIDEKVIRGKKTFCDRYKINRMNFDTLEKDPSRDMFELDWFASICRDYGINPYWLLSGHGEIFTEGAIQKIVNTAREQSGMGNFKVIST